MTDRNAAESLDSDALLIGGSVAILTGAASAALLAEYGWRDLCPRVLTRMTIDSSPLYLEGVGDAGPVPTTGTLHVIVGPEQAPIVAVEVAFGATKPPPTTDLATPAGLPGAPVPSADPRHPVVTPDDGGVPDPDPPRPIPLPPVWEDPPSQTSPACKAFPGLWFCRP